MSSENIFGKIEFIRSERAKHITVRILVDGLRVTLPHSATQEQALKFINTIQHKISTRQGKTQTPKKMKTRLHWMRIRDFKHSLLK